MHSLKDDYWTTEKLDLLEEIMGGPCQISKKISGGNSNVFKFTLGNKDFALKVYPPYAPGGRNRLLAEVSTYQFFGELQIEMVPRLYNFCESSGWLIIDWIDGKTISSYSEQDIYSSLKFIDLMKSLKGQSYSDKLPFAAESCVSLDETLSQIENRLERLLVQKNQEIELSEFLENEFTPVYQFYKEIAINGYKHLGMNFELSSEDRTLIPADFGFHNMLKTKNEKLFFIDFDYFGWDDPVKLLSDILWHPKMNFNEEQKRLFIDGFKNIFIDDKFFSQRLDLNFPIFGLRWILILLNEFIEDFWRNRLHANIGISQKQAKKNQLLKAKKLLAQLKTGCLYE